MYGNMLQWVQDWYAPYPETAVRDYHGPAQGEDHVCRGGGWKGRGRSDVRHEMSPDERYHFIGFRLALSPE